MQPITREIFESEALRLRLVILRVAVSIVGNDDDAADIAQETLIKLWLLRDKLSEYGNIEAPARVIAKNLSINFLRKRNKIVSDKEIADIPVEYEADYTLYSDIITAIESLPDAEQAVLRMKHVEGMETEEIAALIGTTPGAVRTALSRGRRKIRLLFNC